MTGHLIWASIQVTEHNSSLTSYPAIDVDPDACRERWIAYIKTDFEDISTWVRDRVSSFRQERDSTVLSSFSYGETLISRTDQTTITSWTTISMPPQCDGHPRVITESVGESVSTTVRMEHQNFVLNLNTNSSRIIKQINNAYDSPLPPYPACEIAPLHCQSQWSSFQHAFSNWSTTFAEVYGDPLFLNPLCGEAWGGLPPEMNPCFGSEVGNRTLDINDWIGMRQYASQRGFLGGCPQFEDMCLQGRGNYMYDRWWWPKRTFPDDPSKCVVQGDRFALIFFRPSQVTSRDLCANNGWGGEFRSPNTSLSFDMVTKTATLDSIVFPRRSQWNGETLRKLATPCLLKLSTVF